MNKNLNYFKRCIFLSILFFSIFMFGGAVKYFQNSEINNDGSGKITITYSAKSSDVNSNNKIIGNLPFTEQKIKEYFSSENVTVQKALIFFKPEEPDVTYATTDLFFKNLSSLKELKGLSGVDANWVKTDSGMVFRWLFTQENKNKNLIDTYQIFAFFEGKIQSTNGIIEGNKIKWYVFGDKMDPRGAYFTATINSNEPSVNQNNNSQPNTTANNKEIETGSQENKSGGEKKNNKICGSFGIELPLILLAGFAFFTKKERNNLSRSIGAILKQIIRIIQKIKM